MDNEKQPVKAIDPTTNYYGQLAMKNRGLQKTADKANEANYVRQEQFNKLDRAGAMARRMAKVS